MCKLKKHITVSIYVLLYCIYKACYKGALTVTMANFISRMRTVLGAWSHGKTMFPRV